MDSIHPLYAMICIMLSVAAANAAFSLGNSMAYFAVTWCIGRIIHVRAFHHFKVLSLRTDCTKSNG